MKVLGSFLILIKYTSIYKVFLKWYLFQFCYWLFHISSTLVKYNKIHSPLALERYNLSYSNIRVLKSRMYRKFFNISYLLHDRKIFQVYSESVIHSRKYSIAEYWDISGLKSTLTLLEIGWFKPTWTWTLITLIPKLRECFGLLKGKVSNFSVVFVIILSRY